ncbi:hypothetical protein [Apibacter sp. HY039]|uniref:hypothetical protein n=1 Tax=Apibacter sp. HY039 TaxID=2501476 RepID=UPI000FEBB819|nr:hypothetical protein [Apibacter sp. HY039]
MKTKLLIKKWLGCLCLLSVMITVISCSDDDDIVSIQQQTLPVSGKYQWVFEIPNMGTQTSIHDFQTNRVNYQMIGSAYSVEYGMDLLDYDSKSNKLVLKGSEGSAKQDKYFVIFLKDITISTVNMFKKEFSTLQDAKAYSIPADSVSESHGWNVYTKL